MKDYTLHIDLSNVPSENQEAKDQLKSFNDGNKDTTQSKDSNSVAFKNTVAGVGVIMAAKQIQSVASSAINYRISTVGARYGDTARQNQINNIMTQVNMAGGIASSTIAGAMAGSAAGPIGAAVGAAVMAVTSIVGEVVESFQRVDEWNRQQEMNTMNEIRSSERLGLMKTDRNRGR